MTVEFDGITYKVKPNAPSAPDKLNTLAFLLWLNRWTYKRGYHRESVKLPSVPVTER